MLEIKKKDSVTKHYEVLLLFHAAVLSPVSRFVFAYLSNACIVFIEFNLGQH